MILDEANVYEYVKEITGKIDLDEVKAELCKRSFFEFLKEFWGTVEPRPFVYSKHIEFLCGVAQKIFQDFQDGKPGKLTIINLPPSSTKTLIFSVLYPAYCLAVDPTYKILAGSLDMDVATELSVKCRIVMQSDKYKRFYPLSKLRPDDQGKEQQRTMLGGMRVATSYKGNAISKHFCSQIIDDPINTEKVKIPSERQKSNEWLFSALSTRTVDVLLTNQILIQQRLAYNDNTAYALEKSQGKDIEHIVLPAELSDKVKPEHRYLYTQDNEGNWLLDPVRGSMEALKKRRHTLGAYGYKVQVQQDPDNEEDSKVKRSWFEQIDAFQFAALLEGKRKPTINIFADTAFTKNENGKNDPAVFLATVTIDGILYLLDYVRGFWEFPELVDNANKFVLKHSATNPHKLLIEEKASGKSLIQYLKRNHSNINVFPISKLEGKKEDRRDIATGSFESGRVVVVGNQWDDFLTEVCAVNPKYFDQLDCLVHAVFIELLKKSPTSTRRRFSGG